MKKTIKAILATILITAIVVAPLYKVNTPSFKVGATISSNRGGLTTT